MVPILTTQFGKLYQGDCLKILALIESETVDLAFADPPFNLGKEYTSKIDDALAEDHYLTWCESWLIEMVRVLKPGGHLVAFSGTRTYHRMVCAIEDAGFEIRDQIGWAYGSGFPKSHDVSKGIDARERGALVKAKLMHFSAVRGVNGAWLEERGVAGSGSGWCWYYRTTWLCRAEVRTAE